MPVVDFMSKLRSQKKKELTIFVLRAPEEIGGTVKLSLNDRTTVCSFRNPAKDTIGEPFTCIKDRVFMESSVTKDITVFNMKPRPKPKEDPPTDQEIILMTKKEQAKARAKQVKLAKKQADACKAEVAFDGRVFKVKWLKPAYSDSEDTVECIILRVEEDVVLLSNGCRFMTPPDHLQITVLKKLPVSEWMFDSCGAVSYLSFIWP
jgi:hypothetical protein